MAASEWADSSLHSATLVWAVLASHPGAAAGLTAVQESAMMTAVSDVRKQAIMTATEIKLKIKKKLNATILTDKKLLISVTK